MQEIKGIAILPPPIKAVCKAFLHRAHGPEIFEASSSDEMDKLAEDQTLIFQLMFDRDWHKWYLLAVGEEDREIKSEIWTPNPMRIKRALLVFCHVDEAWIRNKRAEYQKQSMSGGDQFVEWEGGEEGGWVQ